ncbi:MAG: hypothetical protein HYR72_22140 [Deltaproteobacteria bacterium]|nr:hypothetical protein [Deltaproteobacteria bacterium]MBI3390549.1 hypothetical protein [Deltaproteobacteria bacterium]
MFIVRIRCEQHQDEDSLASEILNAIAEGGSNVHMQRAGTALTSILGDAQKKVDVWTRPFERREDWPDRELNSLGEAVDICKAVPLNAPDRQIAVNLMETVERIWTAMAKRAVKEKVDYDEVHYLLQSFEKFRGAAAHPERIRELARQLCHHYLPESGW